VSSDKKETRIRMRKAPDSTLNGYIFTDDAHAKAWLSQMKVEASDVRLEVVEVGSMCRCSKCGGSGFTQKVRKVADIGLEEVLRG